METERRSITSELADIQIETRDGGLSGIKGIAAAYFTGDASTEFKFGRVIERIMPGAFSRSLANGDDVLALINHDQNLLLARRSSKTLRLTNTDAGLRYSIDTPNTSYARDLVEMIGRGDLRGSSFAFTVNGPAGESWSTSGDTMVRELRDVNLIDISVVAAPAYAATSVDLRYLETLAEVRKAEMSMSESSPFEKHYLLDLKRKRLALIKLQSGLR